MEKTEFTYQCWYFRILCAGLIVPIVFVISLIILSLADINDIIFLLINAVLAILGATLYYKYTENTPLFLKKGYCWIENGVVFIQTAKKVYEIKNVTWLRGCTTSAYGSKAGMLIVKHEKLKTILFSKSSSTNTSFSATQLYPVFQAILSNNPQLKKDADLDDWYEAKKV